MTVRRIKVGEPGIGQREIVAPTLHSNGSGHDNLLRDWLDAHHKLREAEGALCRMRPHDRDYYVQGDGALAAAQEEHEARISVVRQIMNDLEALARDLTA